MWNVVRIPFGGPIDEDSARPFVPLGPAVPLLNGIQWRKGSVLPWRVAAYRADSVDVASRRFGELLVRYDSADTNEVHVVDGQERTTSFPGSTMRVIEHWKGVRGASVDATGGFGWFDACETSNWVIVANWRRDGLRITARHKGSGHVIEKTFALASSGGLPVWPYPRVLRDWTQPDSFVVSYVQTDIANLDPILSVAKHSMDRYSVTLTGGIMQDTTYISTVYAVSSLSPGGPLHPFHDAREAAVGVLAIAYSDDDVSSYRLRLVHVDTGFNRVERVIGLTRWYPTALGYAKSGGYDTAVFTCCDGTSTQAQRWRFQSGAWVAQSDLPLPSHIISRVADTAIGGDQTGGWRIVVSMRILGYTEAATPVLTHDAMWGYGGGGVGESDSWDQHSVPFYERGTWFHLIRCGNHAVITAEYGSGMHVEGSYGVKNQWRLVPIARVGTWVTTDHPLMCAYPRQAYGSASRRLVVLRTQTSSDCDIDVYVLDTNAATQHWEHDTIGVGPSKEACAGLLMSPDTVTMETGFVFGPVVAEFNAASNTCNIALQWERVGRDGEIHRSLPTAFTTDRVFRVGTLLTRAETDVRLLVWSTDAAGVYRLIKTIPISPYDQYTDWITPSVGATGQIAPWYGQLSHGPSPSPWHACMHGNRVWVISAEDRSSVWPSLVMSDPLVAPAFPAALVVIAPDDRLHRIYSTDVGAVVLGSKHIYIVRGDGADNTGNGAPFELYSVPGAIGCTGQACQTPWGVIYASDNSVVLLDRGVAVHSVSDQVREKIHDKTVLSMVYWPALQRAVVLYDGFMLLWHPERGWSSITMANSLAVRVADNGNLEVLTPNTPTAYQYSPLDDNYDATDMRVSTAWLDAAVQPWIRIRKVRIRARRVGVATSTAQISVRIYANGNDLAPAETRTITVADMQTSGDALYYTTRLSYQKYETIRVELRTYGNVSLEWEWVELEFLARRGVAKIGSA